MSKTEAATTNFSQNEKTKSDESSKTSTFSTETKAEKLLGEIQITKDDFLEEDVDLNDNDDEMIYTSVLLKLKAYAAITTSSDESLCQHPPFLPFLLFVLHDVVSSNNAN